MTSTTAQFLVFGSTGSIGYAFTKELLHNQEQVTLLVRNKQKALKLFGQQQNLQIIEGDAQDADLLKKLGSEATHIFHGVNYPYDKWTGNMEAVTSNIIEAASVRSATILFPGNIYNYGLAKKITEETQEAPCSRKGEIRKELEQTLRKAAEMGKCQVINLRLPDFWGPNVVNEVIAPIFKGALTGKAMPWLIRNDIPHQLVYTPDAARAFYELAKLQPEAPYALYNYGGEVVPSIKKWQAQIAAIAGTKPTHKMYSKGFINILSLFMPIMREIKEMTYLWENTLILQDDKLRQTLTAFPHTPMPVAIQETLAWFSKN